MDAFVAMRHYINNQSSRLANIEQNLINNNNKLMEHDKLFIELFNKFGKEKKNRIFFEGQIYDAYSFLIDKLSKN